MLAAQSSDGCISWDDTYVNVAVWVNIASYTLGAMEDGKLQ